MKPLLILPAVPALLLLLCHPAKAQDKGDESFYVFDAAWKPTDLKAAVYFLHVKKVDTSTWEWDYYNYSGPLVKTESFQDKDATRPEGRFSYYFSNGLIDSSGSVVNGKLNGTWWQWDSTGKLLFTRDYDSGRLVKEIDHRNDPPHGNEKDNDSTKESEFKGGQSGWIRYMNKHFRYPDRAINFKKEGQVYVLFMINEEGKVCQPYITRSVEYSIDEEALKLLRECPNWIPGKKNGKLIKTYKKQPVIFKLEP